MCGKSMKVKMLYWADQVGGKVERLNVELKPFGYRMAPVTQWKTLIAEEDVEVEKGKPVVVKVRTIDIPENTIIGPLNIMRHALGTVIDVVECGIPDRVEEEKCIDQVLFVPVDDGVIKAGDLVGVLKVFFIKTGLLSRIPILKPPKVELREEIVEANITWRDNGNIYRESMKTKVFGYTRSHVGVWELLIADERVKVKKGDIVRIRIKEVDLPPNTVVVPLSFMRNAYGSVLDVVQLGRPSRVEDEKRIQQAIFLGVEDGWIEEGDLIGVINVYFVGVEKLSSIPLELEPKEANLVYKSGEGVIRKNVTIEPFGYKRAATASWEVLIADERKEVRYGEPCLIKIKRVRIPRNTIVYPMCIMRHAYGAFVDLYSDIPLQKVEEERYANKVIFYPIADGEVKEGEILGIVNLYSVEVGSLRKVKQWLDGWLDEMGEAFAESDWPMW
jgi:hypothetical protein